MTQSTRHSIHLAAMPFPSPQGTQASIAAMLQALSQRGDTPELWTYAHGDQHPGSWQPGFRVRRLWDVPRDRSLRSGPSIKKVLLDAQLAARLTIQAPPFVIAHHVEAAMAAWLARRPFTFFAHTDLGHELPTYAPQLPHGWISRLGSSLDRQLGTHAASVAAISPRLSQMLERVLERPVIYVPTPWEAQPAPTDDQRAQARRDLGLQPDAPVLLYAGNLDPYQGWERLLEAAALIQRSHRDVMLLIATASDPKPLWLEAQRAGVAHAITLAPLTDEGSRKRCHSAADLCLIPRRTDGGLPIKLLDALARSVPIVAARRATAGLPLDGALEIVADDSGEAIASAALQLLQERTARERIRTAGSAYLREHHGVANFLAAFDRLQPT